MPFFAMSTESDGAGEYGAGPIFTTCTSSTGVKPATWLWAGMAYPRESWPSGRWTACARSRKKVVLGGDRDLGAAACASPCCSGQFLGGAWPAHRLLFVLIAFGQRNRGAAGTARSSRPRGRRGVTNVNMAPVLGCHRAGRGASALYSSEAVGHSGTLHRCGQSGAGSRAVAGVTGRLWSTAPRDSATSA